MKTVPSVYTPLVSIIYLSHNTQAAEGTIAKKHAVSIVLLPAIPDSLHYQEPSPSCGQRPAGSRSHFRPYSHFLDASRGMGGRGVNGSRHHKGRLYWFNRKYKIKYSLFCKPQYHFINVTLSKKNVVISYFSQAKIVWS